MSSYSYAPTKLIESLPRERWRVSSQTWVVVSLALVFLSVACGFRLGCFFASERARQASASLMAELRETEQSLARLQVSLEQGQTPAVIAEWAERHRFISAFEAQNAPPEL